MAEKDFDEFVRSLRLDELADSIKRCLERAGIEVDEVTVTIGGKNEE